MIAQASFALRGRNPDILTCIANLSNDEVFTPPEFANRMLDTLEESWASSHGGASIWEDPSVTFLDPCTKSGVFLREITIRLTEGLAGKIPDLQKRVDHILTKQVFGIAITRLTALLARRSLYCSKVANGTHSVARSFADVAGNVAFPLVDHTWDGERCRYCGAGKSVFDRPEGLERHAYAFIHGEDARATLGSLFGGRMQFDVIIGNPPYQLASDGGTRDVPIYQHFVEQAKSLAPTMLMMVIPSRWMATGLGLTEFRERMLADRRIRVLVDFPAASEVFPNVEIKAGVCYFLWDSIHNGDCDVTTVRGKDIIGPVQRNLGEHDIFVRDQTALGILNKILKHGERSINTLLARDKEFGWTSNFTGFHTENAGNYIPLYYIRQVRRYTGYIPREEVTKSSHLIDTWKVMVPAAGSDGGQRLPDYVLGKPLIAPSPSVCTQSYLFFYCDTEYSAKSILSYYTTRFFRFLVSLRKITQHATHNTYYWVPLQAWDTMWSDEHLYQKYGITDAEQEYISAHVKQMNVADADD